MVCPCKPARTQTLDRALLCREPRPTHGGRLATVRVPWRRRDDSVRGEHAATKVTESDQGILGELRCQIVSEPIRQPGVAANQSECEGSAIVDVSISGKLECGHRLLSCLRRVSRKPPGRQLGLLTKPPSPAAPPAEPDPLPGVSCCVPVAGDRSMPGHKPLWRRSGCPLPSWPEPVRPDDPFLPGHLSGRRDRTPA